MDPNSQRRYVDLTDRYKDWRNKAKAEAFNTAVMAHATTTIRYSADVVEHIDRVMHMFDRHFPLNDGIDLFS